MHKRTLTPGHSDPHRTLARMSNAQIILENKNSLADDIQRVRAQPRIGSIKSDREIVHVTGDLVLIALEHVLVSVRVAGSHRLIDPNDVGVGVPRKSALTASKRDFGSEETEAHGLTTKLEMLAGLVNCHAPFSARRASTDEQPGPPVNQKMVGSVALLLRE